MTNADLTEAKQDAFLRWAAADLIAKGLDGDQAWRIVLNTYCPEHF